MCAEFEQTYLAVPAFASGRDELSIWDVETEIVGQFTGDIIIALKVNPYVIHWRNGYHCSDT